MTPDLLLQLMLPTPLLAAVAILLARKNPNLRDGLMLVFGAVLFVLTASFAYQLGFGEATITAKAAGEALGTSGAIPTLVYAEPIPGLALALSPEPLGLLFALIASLLWPVTATYAIGYMRGHGEINQTRFYTCFAISISATLGIALAANLFTLFIFYEVLTLATFPLVTHAGTPAAKRAGRVYLGILMGTSVAFMLLATIWTFHLTGTLEFQPGGIFPDGTDPGLMSILLLLFVFGTGKAALMPFHRWLPAAMVAPTPVSALLHAVAVVKAGVFTVMKIAVYIFGVDNIAQLDGATFLSYAAGFTILAGSVNAMKKDNLKARLAYSTISQLSYIVLGAMIGTSAGVVGGSMHIAMHAFGKITLFFCAGAILVASHRTKVSELHGIGRQMPWTMTAFTIGALSIIGLPPMGGTWSKWLLVQGTLDAGAWVLMSVLLLSTLLNIAYILVIPLRAFFSPLATSSHDHKLDTGDTIQEAPLPCLIGIGITALGCIVLFFLPHVVHDLAMGVGK